MSADRSSENLTLSKGPRRLGDLARPLLAPALRRQGFAQHEIVTRWREIVGPLLGARSLPERLTFPRGQRRGGTLMVLVETSMALEFQHLTPQVLERVNTYYGYKAVERIVLRQGPLPRREAKAAGTAAELTPEKAAELDRTLADVRPGPTRDALGRLGKRLLGTPPNRRS